MKCTSQTAQVRFGDEHTSVILPDIPPQTDRCVLCVSATLRKFYECVTLGLGEHIVQHARARDIGDSLTFDLFGEGAGR